ncbi:hypothetical protein GCM10022200_09280 [Microbacterium awajiense]|uniref:SGNH hydrolase-type esterase domain-containing protein n=1 Tax=Microbacterium awajiense TaxID=415214 RepID=A0ABP7ABW1_9MICO
MRVGTFLAGAAMLLLGAALALAAGGWWLRHQAALARRRIGKPLGEKALDADRVWRRRLAGAPIDLVVLGDSIAAGLGAEHRKETLGGRIAKGVARRSGRPVRLRVAAVVGSESSALAGQLDALPDQYRPEVAVIVVGGNDVTHRVPIAQSAAYLAEAVRRLRERGAEVVVGTCPDLGALHRVPQPLRELGSRMSRRLAAAQARAASEAGAHVVSLRDAVGEVFLAEPDEMFSVDSFHPSAAGYRRTAEALVPSITDALTRR